MDLFLILSYIKLLWEHSQYSSDCIKLKNKLPNGQMSNNSHTIKMFLTIRISRGKFKTHFHSDLLTGELRN